MAWMPANIAVRNLLSTISMHELRSIDTWRHSVVPVYKNAVAKIGTFACSFSTLLNGSATIFLWGNIVFTVMECQFFVSMIELQGPQE
jgi:hypothetical protein